MRKRLRRLAAFLVVKLLVGIAAVAPQRLGRWFFGGLGRLAYLTFRGPRRAALVNLRLIYGGRLAEAEIRGIAARVFVNLGKFAYDVVSLDRLGPDALKRSVRALGLERLDGALAKGRGVIVLTGHVGNWELLATYLCRSGYPLSVLAARLKDSRLDDLVAGLRRRGGTAVLERSRGLKEAIGCLRRGEILGVLIDQDTAVSSVVVDFLGLPAKTAVGPVRLSAMTGAAIVPMAMMMTADGCYSLEIGNEVEIGGTGDSLKEDVERCSKAVEGFILAEPSQWVWMHRRWKSVLSDLY